MKPAACKFSEDHACDETCGSGALVVQMLPVIDQVATGQEIRKRRCQAMLSLREVAKTMGWSAAYQSDLELGRKRWTEAKCREVECAIVRLSSQKQSCPAP